MGHFIVETDYPKLFTKFSFARLVIFAKCIWITKRDSHFFKNVLWLAGSSLRNAEEQSVFDSKECCSGVGCQD